MDVKANPIGDELIKLGWKRTKASETEQEFMLVRENEAGEFVYLIRQVLASERFMVNTLARVAGIGDVQVWTDVSWGPATNDLQVARARIRVQGHFGGPDGAVGEDSVVSVDVEPSTD